MASASIFKFIAGDLSQNKWIQNVVITGDPARPTLNLQTRLRAFLRRQAWSMKTTETAYSSTGVSQNAGTGPTLTQPAGGCSVTGERTGSYRLLARLSATRRSKQDPGNLESATESFTLSRCHA